MRGLLIFIHLFIFSSISYASQYNVYGKLEDAKTKTPIEFANIAVKDINSGEILTVVISDFKGEFSFSIKKGTYNLEVTCIGYEPVNKTIKIIDRDLYIKTIQINADSKELSEVNVVASSYKEEYDKSVQYVSKSFKEGASTLTDLLSKIQGVYVDPLDKSVKVNNETNILLLVDGIKKKSSYIKDLPPDRIARIEITRNPTGRYISEGYSAVINVILKKNYSGYYLSVENRSFLSLDKSNGDDILFKNNATANLTYTFKRINVYGSYSNSKTNTNLLEESVKLLKTNSYHKTSPSSKPNIIKDAWSNTYLIGFDFFINSNQVISIETNFIQSPFSQNKSVETYNNAFEINNISTNFISNLSNNHSTDANYSQLSYRNKLSDKNRLEIDLGYNFVKSKIANIYKENNKEQNNQQLENKNNISVLELNFEHSFSSKYSIELGYRNNYRTYNYTFLSNNNETINNKDIRNIAYTYFSITPKGKIKSKIGFAFEQNILSLQNKSKYYYSLQPFLNIFYKHSKNFNVTLKFNTNCNYPYSKQISPFETTTDRLTSEIGNPTLSFAENYRGAIDFKLFKNRLSIEPFYSITKNFISQTGEIIDEHYRYSFSNLDNYQSMGVKLSTRLSLIPRKLMLNFSSLLYFDETKFNSYNNKVNDISINANLMYLNFKYKTLFALMFKKMNTKQIRTYGYYNNDNDYLAVFIKQAFFKRRLNLSLMYILPVDIGIDYTMRTTYEHIDFEENNNTNVNILTNLFMFKLSYNINKGVKIKSIKKKDYKEKKEASGLL